MAVKKIKIGVIKLKTEQVQKMHQLKLKIYK